MGNLRGTMPGRPSPGKHLWHGESACPHAAKSGLGCRKTGAQKLTKCKHASPIPVCSQINNCDGDQLWKYPVQGCGRTQRPVARIPQITSVDPGSLRPPGRHRGMAVGGDASAIARTGPRVRINRSRKNRIEDGMSLLEGVIDSRNNPLAVVEDIAADNNWAFERSGEDEVTIVSKGDWTDYQLSFTWMGEIEALHLACAFDMKIPTARRGEVQRLIAAINEQLWVGHFDIWTHTGMIMYRQALVLPGGLTASTAQCETMLVGAIHACERYYPAFQFVVWAGKTAAEAMSAAMFDTQGEA